MRARSKIPTILALFLLGCFFITADVRAQDMPAQDMSADSLSIQNILPAPEEEAQEMESFPVVKLQSLDKITARTMTFEADVGKTLKFGELYIKVQACRKASPIETPESAAFLQIWEITPEEKSKWVFSGWMFASSPALSHMDHPIYDVWVLDCLSEKGQATKEMKEQALQGEGEVEEDQVPAQPAPTDNKAAE